MAGNIHAIVLRGPQACACKPNEVPAGAQRAEGPLGRFGFSARRAPSCCLADESASLLSDAEAAEYVAEKLVGRQVTNDLAKV